MSRAARFQARVAAQRLSLAPAALLHAGNRGGGRATERSLTGETTEGGVAPEEAEAAARDGGVSPRRSRGWFSWLVWASPSSQRSRSFFQTPEMMIFALGMAAMLALIVLMKDVITKDTFRPTSVLVFAATGTYCIVLIKRQRALADAEQALVLEILEARSSEPYRRVMTKEERRSHFRYFTFEPTENGPLEGKQTPGGKGDSGGGTSPAADVVATPHACSSEGPREDGEHHCARHNQAPTVASAAAAADSGSGSDSDSDSDMGEAGAEAAGAGAASEPTALDSARAILARMVGDLVAAIGGAATASEEERPNNDAVDVVHAEARESEPSPQARDDGHPVLATELEAGAGVASPGRAGSPNRKREGTSGEHEEEEKNCPARELSRGESWGWCTGGQCIVCFGEYTYGDTLCQLPCRHLYHAECIDEWLDGIDHAWCPLCKMQLLPEARDGTGSGSGSNGASSAEGADNVNDNTVPANAANDDVRAVGDEAV